MKRKVFTRLLYVSLLISIVLPIFYYNQEILGSFKKIKWHWLTLIILIQTLVILCHGYTFKVLSCCYQIELKWQEWMGLSFIANLLNQLLPYRPGMGFRFFYLKKKHHIKMSEFIYISLIFFLCMITISAALAALGWIFSPYLIEHRLFTLVIFSTGLLSFIFLFWLVFKKQSISSKSSELVIKGQSIKRAMDALQFIMHSPRIVLSAILTLLLASLLQALLFYFNFHAINAAIPFSLCLFLVGVFVVVMLFPITPGNVGVLETAFGTLTQLIYNDFGIGFSSIALFRLCQFLPAVILGSAFCLLLVGSFHATFNAIRMGRKSIVD